jgi:tRNA_anti-like
MGSGTAPDSSTKWITTKSIWVIWLVLYGFISWTGCQRAALGSREAISAESLIEEYEKSSAAVRSNYDGKEITVRGYAVIAAKMPQPGDDQGSVLLEEQERRLARRVACWFSKDHSEQFSKIKGEQYLTVRGIFNGEAGPDLKFCKLVKIE